MEPGRRRPPLVLVILAAVTVVALAAVVANVVLAWRAHDTALAAYTDALEARNGTAQRLETASGALADAVLALAEIRDHAGLVAAAAPAELVDADAAAGLATTVADAVAAFEAELAAVDPSPTRDDSAIDDSAIDGVAIEEPAAASTDQLEHARTELERELAILRRDLDEIDERRLDAETAAAGIDAAIAAHLEAAATIGAALLEDRADASQETRDALAAAIEALSESTSADAAVALAAYAETAAAVVASSDQARNPAPGVKQGTIADQASITVVVNKQRSLSSSYIPPGLVVPPGIPNNNGQSVRSELVGPLQAMQADMAAAGIELRIASAYRSYATQASIYSRNVANQGQAAADTHSARPGHSEHQTGLAVDLDDGTGCVLRTCFASTAGGIWLRDNAHRYGFILRYPQGYEHIHGYMFEPWHYRFVGVDVATAMHASGTPTLEQYLGLPAAPGY